jgi:hypothetical protein
MAQTVVNEMKFRRDDYRGPACLEYSWVPQGLRHHILLVTGQQEGRESDSIPDTIRPSHVQVYVLTNNEKWSTEGWQFPAGPPHATPVVRATVEVYQQKMTVVGTVYYADGTSASYEQPLEPVARKCPQLA